MKNTNNKTTVKDAAKFFLGKKEFMGTYMMGKTLLVESGSTTDYIIKQWYGDRVRLRFFDSSETKKMFHAWG